MTQTTLRRSGVTVDVDTDEFVGMNLNATLQGEPETVEWDIATYVDVPADVVAFGPTRVGAWIADCLANAVTDTAIRFEVAVGPGEAFGSLG